MAKVILAVFGVVELILFGSDSGCDQVFFATKTIGAALGLAALALWALWARGGEV